MRACRMPASAAHLQAISSLPAAGAVSSRNSASSARIRAVPHLRHQPAFPGQRMARRWCRDRRTRASSRATRGCGLPSATIDAGSPGRRGAMRTGNRARGALDRVDHFEHRIAVAIAAIERRAGAAVAQVIQRGAMGAGQIGDVDVVADAGAVGRRIVGAEDLQLRAQPSAASTATLIRWVASGVDWPVRCLRIGAGDVEIAQDDMAETVRRSRRRAA